MEVKATTLNSLLSSHRASIKALADHHKSKPGSRGAETAKERHERAEAKIAEIAGKLGIAA